LALKINGFDRNIAIATINSPPTMAGAISAAVLTPANLSHCPWVLQGGGY